jgi:four helix bundle suffix protein
VVGEIGEIGEKNTMENFQKNASRPGYEYLVAFMLGKVVQDLTVTFCDRFIDKKSRTHDQMVQAARSNPQNVAEGYTAESLKSYIFLTGVAHGSNEELTKDYQDFLRQRTLPIWEKTDPRVRVFRGFRVGWISPTALNTPSLSTDAEDAANFLLTLCQMEGFLLAKLAASLKKKHETEGGFTEKLYRKRKEFRGF